MLGAGVVVSFQVVAGNVILECQVVSSVFSPSVVESPLPLLLFKFIEVSMSAGCSTSGCYFKRFFFFFWDIDVDSLKGAAVVDVLIGDDLTGDFFFSIAVPMLLLMVTFFLVTWIHPSSLLGWSLVSVSLITIVVFVNAAVLVVVVKFVFLRAGSGKMAQLFTRPTQ